MATRYYACIDLKSFYASVECVERGLDPFTTNLAVTDASRGNGAICLAISPAMKALGIPNRCRVFQIPQNVEYISALPRMKLYMKYSADIYSIYLKYISKEDIHVYSIDECFFDLTPYLKTYKKTPKELSQMLIEAVYQETGICASAGIGTNLFLAKVALDITAKHTADHIGYLDEALFKKLIWPHRPITDIWNIGKGIAKRLERYGVYDLRGVCDLDEKLLYREFGVNAEFLIDHAHGYEPCTMEEIHHYQAQSHSVTNSQILFEDYGAEDALRVVLEMVDLLTLELVEEDLTTDSISLRVGYSKDVVKATGGTRKLSYRTSSFNKLAEEMKTFFKETTRAGYPIRKVSVGLNHVMPQEYTQMDLFSEFQEDEREKKVQKAMVEIKNKFGKNAILRGMSLEEKATARMRNKLVGGHNGGE